MIVGRVLYGIGSGTVVIVQETILSQWFQGQSLATMIALLLTVSRLVSIFFKKNKIVYHLICTLLHNSLPF